MYWPLAPSMREEEIVPELPYSSGSTVVALRPDGRRSSAMARILSHAEITQTLYPPPNVNRSIGYSTPNGRAALTTGDYHIVCNGHYLTTAFPNASYAYRFSVPPGIHGSDLPYTFYINGTATATTQSINATLALLIQRYFLNFAIAGSPNGLGVPRFPLYGGEAEEILSSTMVGVAHDDDLRAARCKWWQKGLYR